MDEIKVETAKVEMVSTEMEWCIPVMRWNNEGVYWFAGQMVRTKEEAESAIRSACQEVSAGRIVRVLLPCSVIGQKISLTNKTTER